MSEQQKKFEVKMEIPEGYERVLTDAGIQIRPKAPRFCIPEIGGKPLFRLDYQTGGERLATEPDAKDSSKGRCGWIVVVDHEVSTPLFGETEMGISYFNPEWEISFDGQNILGISPGFCIYQFPGEEFLRIRPKGPWWRKTERKLDVPPGLQPLLDSDETGKEPRIFFVPEAEWRTVLHLPQKKG